VALVDACATARHDRLLLVGGDMPDLVPSLLRRVLGFGAAYEGACLVVDGWPQPFPMGLDRTAASAHGRDLVAADERSLRSLMRSLAIEQIAEPDWRALDPRALSLHDIDRPEDLAS
jgi:molybdopterin-guanine dinucleotide biosynthesis protein A